MKDGIFNNCYSSRFDFNYSINFKINLVVMDM